MTSKEIVELLCELVDLKELTNRGLILKDINNFQDQLEKDLEVLEILKGSVRLKENTLDISNANIALFQMDYVAFKNTKVYKLLKECLVNEK